MNKNRVFSPHFNERKLPIDSIILHYTDMPSTDEVLRWFTNPHSNVSAHYLIDEEGQIYHLIEEDKRAWHAGESYWQGCTDLNSCSIGIELSNPGHSYGYRPFPEAQIEGLLKLSKEIQIRWGIPRSHILGHSDIAPRRKQDPGHLFPWERLAIEGLGLWPSPSSRKFLQKFPLDDALHKIGYEILSLSHALTAFQRHFQPHKWDGEADEQTYALIDGLLEAQKKLI